MSIAGYSTVLHRFGSGKKSVITVGNQRCSTIAGKGVCLIRLIANIIWIVTGGWITALGWAFAGIVFYVSIIGIPLGRVAFKMAALSLAPFGKTIVYGGGAPSLIGNIVWCCFAGIWMAIVYVMGGCAFCLTIIGMPVGIQLFKMAKLSFFPFGARVLG